MTTPDQIESSNDRCARVFAEVVAVTLQHGLEFARRDDPHAFARVAKWKQDVGGQFQLRITFDAAGGVNTQGLVCDRDGEALAEVFTINAAGATAQ